MRRLTITIAAALTVAATLTGCTANDGPTASPTPTSKPTATAAATTPTATETAAADPKAVQPTAAPDAPTTEPAPAPPAAAPKVAPLAQHIYDECSKGAAAAGVRLTFTAEPSGYSNPDGSYQLIYPFVFLDGHNDPYAIHNCGLSDNTVNSTFINGGMTDSH